VAVNINTDGSFTLSIGADSLSKGLRPSSKLPRNNGYLTTCDGAVGSDETLTTLDEITRLATGTITDVFPYPQIFVFTNVIIVCSSTTIYEWVSGSLVSKLVTTAGSTWVAVDYHDFVYLSNGTVAVIRNATDKTYSETTDLPTSMAACNFNGQMFIGAPDLSGLGANLTINAGSGTITLTGVGEWT